MDTNQRKVVQLGMPFGTAMNRLKKKVLFSLLQKVGEDICYRCNKQILSVRELSIDHKKVWLDVSSELFWDLANIAFSHHSCNVRLSRKMSKQPISHGTRSGYSYRGCRCDACKKAQYLYNKNWRETHKRR